MSPGQRRLLYLLQLWWAIWLVLLIWRAIFGGHWAAVHAVLHLVALSAGPTAGLEVR